MKHQYFGDVNDFRKYGLLRAISKASGLPVGMLWLLTTPDERTDGELRNYLREPHRWRHFDPELYDALAQALQPGSVRTLDHTKSWGLLHEARYFDRVVTDTRPERHHYMDEASKALAPCPILFLDPDNGIEVKSVPYGSKKSSKYVYWHELKDLFKRGHSLIVYQHYPRLHRLTFETSLLKQFQANLGTTEIAVFSTPNVAFVFAVHDPPRFSVAGTG